MTKQTTEATVVARYKAHVVPSLRAAGFEGTLANLTLHVGRGQLLAYLSRSSGTVTMGISGNDGRESFILTHVHFAPGEPAAETQKKLSAYGACLDTELRRRIEELRSDVVAPPPATLADAARALLAWLARDADFVGLDVTDAKADGRDLIVRVRGRAKPIRVDRSALMTLLRELRGGEPGPEGRDLRYALHGAELVAYLAKIGEESAGEARNLWVHLCSAYDLPHGDHRLAPLFVKTKTIAKELDTAASAGALVARALPFAQRRSTKLLDRITAIRILTSTLSYAANHRNAESLLEDASSLASSLGKESDPLLRECEIGRAHV